jgi:hypothetical protein
MTDPTDEKREESVTALFELSSKFAHSCDPNAEYDWDDGVLTHKTLRAVAPGEVVTVNYYSGGWAESGAVSTAVRRHRLMRGKFFLCHCTLCSAPDALAALPCPACTTREGDGTLPLGRIFDSQADAEDWEHPMFIKMRDHPVVVPDGDAAEAAAAAPSWRCTSCGGVFSRDSMARLIIAAGVRRPLPRSEMLSARYGPASLLDVARWAESNSIFAEFQTDRLVSSGSPDVIFAPGGIAEVNLGRLNTLINEFAAIVGTSHASVTLLRLLRLKVALRGTFSYVNDPSKKPPSRAQMAAIVRRLLTVRSGSAAAAISASALLAAEVAALAAILRRGKRMFGMYTLLPHFACVMDSLGGLEDPSMARCVTQWQRRIAYSPACSLRQRTDSSPFASRSPESRRLVLDLLREVEKSKYDALDPKKAQAFAMMQHMVLAHAPFWTRGGGSSAA